MSAIAPSTCGRPTFNGTVYTWMTSGRPEDGGRFLIDNLTHDDGAW